MHNPFANIFTSSAPVAPVAPVAAPVNQGNIPSAPTVTVNPDGTPVVAPLPVEPEQSPLAEFKSLWDTAPVDPDASKGPLPFTPPTAEEVQKAVAKADFSKSFTPEQLATVTGGGEGAQEALLQLLNTVGQQSLAQSTMVSSQLSQKAIEQAIAVEVAKMPAMLRQQSANDHLKTSNPVFSNPAVKPIVEATQHQLQAKFPNATNAELTEMTEKFIVAMGESFAPVPDAAALAPGETDWNSFFDHNSGAG
jgi:hypothetical protein